MAHKSWDRERMRENKCYSCKWHSLIESLESQTQKSKESFSCIFYSDRSEGDKACAVLIRLKDN